MQGEPRNDGGTGPDGDQRDVLEEVSNRGLPGRLVGWIEEYDDAPDVLTVFPADASESERVVTWLSATEGSYVDLVDMQ